jgi:hypothetical protein
MRALSLALAAWALAACSPSYPQASQPVTARTLSERVVPPASAGVDVRPAAAAAEAPVRPVAIASRPTAQRTGMIRVYRSCAVAAGSPGHRNTFCESP